MSYFVGISPSFLRFFSHFLSLHRYSLLYQLDNLHIGPLSKVFYLSINFVPSLAVYDNYQGGNGNFVGTPSAFFSEVFINIHESEKSVICILDHQ